MGKNPAGPTDREDPSGEWRGIAAGARPRLEPKPAKSPADSGGLSISEERHEPAAPSSDPYNRVGSPAQDSHEKAKRRSLDDMRQLSEAIKKAPRWERPAKSAAAAVTLFERLAELRTDLERVLSALDLLCAVGAAPGDAAMADLIEQLRRAALHVEEASDCMMPPEDQHDRPLPEPRDTR